MSLLSRFRSLSKLRKLTPARAFAIVRAQMALVAAGRLVKTKPLGELVAVSESKSAAPRKEDPELSAHLAWSVVQAARYGFYRPSCLVRSVAIQRLLDQHDLDTGQIKIGVRWDGDDGFLAHAWVEQDGRILGDRWVHVRQFDPVTDMRLVKF